MVFDRGLSGAEVSPVVSPVQAPSTQMLGFAYLSMRLHTFTLSLPAKRNVPTRRPQTGSIDAIPSYFRPV